MRRNRYGHRYGSVTSRVTTIVTPRPLPVLKNPPSLPTPTRDVGKTGRAG